jgi:hypothetical protein
MGDRRGCFRGFVILNSLVFLWSLGRFGYLWYLVILFETQVHDATQYFLYQGNESDCARWPMTIQGILIPTNVTFPHPYAGTDDTLRLLQLPPDTETCGRRVHSYAGLHGPFACDRTDATPTTTKLHQKIGPYSTTRSVLTRPGVMIVYSIGAALYAVLFLVGETFRVRDIRYARHETLPETPTRAVAAVISFARMICSSSVAIVQYIDPNKSCIAEASGMGEVEQWAAFLGSVAPVVLWLALLLPLLIFGICLCRGYHPRMAVSGSLCCAFLCCPLVGMLIVGAFVVALATPFATGILAIIRLVSAGEINLAYNIYIATNLAYVPAEASVGVMRYLLQSTATDDTSAADSADSMEAASKALPLAELGIGRHRNRLYPASNSSPTPT